MLLSAVFLVFNLFYWPVNAYQERSHPFSFVAYAHYLQERGLTEEALQTLHDGIAGIRPPAPEPYEALARIERQAQDSPTPDSTAARARFYRSLQSDPPNKNGVVMAVESLSQPYQEMTVTPRSIAQIKRAARSFGAAFDLRDALEALPPYAQIAMFDLAGGVFSFDGHIGDTGVLAPMPMLVYSGGGMDARRNAHILVGGIDYGDTQRGFHAVVLDAGTGAILQTGVFDLWESVAEARRMLFFLADAPAGCIGLFAVRDDGSAFMTSALENALLEFGLDRKAMVGRSRALFGLRYSFAAIGVKGATPGTAMQTWSPDHFKNYRGHPVVCGIVQTKGTP